MSDEKGEFVIRIHHAERAGLHYDLHLNGESWAIPKGMPSKPGIKHLAIATAYHSPEQARFEGTIPKGQYGAGTTEIVDEGEYILINQTPSSMFFQLHGDMYTGNYYLRHWKGSHWLLWHQP
ncbi:3'-phosphoesterase [Patescibacteria group bacterium]|nr:3'-phosphoesterase [Patescibacteria group bacterium]